VARTGRLCQFIGIADRVFIGTMQPNILIVEDDAEICGLVARYLKEHDMTVFVAADGKQMDRVLAAQRVDLLILDLMLPGEDGLSICRRLRIGSNLPIIILTAQKDDIERIIGLEMGADDYITKPFNPRELRARIRAVLRRHSAPDHASIAAARTYAFKGWQLDTSMRRLFDPAGARVTLTGAEFDLLAVFCQRPGRVLTREALIDLAQGPSTRPLRGLLLSVPIAG
jgi:two-component system OmpR family response regulator